MDKKTPLYEAHVRLGGKIVPFAGYLMPVQYTDILKEHAAVRTGVGLFDVSHMGEFLLSGPGAFASLQHLLTNDYANMPEGRVRYSPMCYENGGVVDDLLVYRRGAEDYLIVVNASNKDKDFEWMSAHLCEGAVLEDISEKVGEIAVQGPLSGELLQKLTAPENLPEKYYWFVEQKDVAGVTCLISQTGYTGEYGFELYCRAEETEKLWNALLEAGADLGAVPCGLGCRDTLRLEASMPLYGHEMDENVTPLETGLGFAVKLGKEEFIGREALLAAGDPKICRVGLKVTGRGIVREHMDVFADGAQVGHTTSGTVLPTVGGAHAMALIDKAFSAPGTPLTVNVRGREVAVEVEPLPFYRRKK
ncbi:MAG: glycine cleavage system aminomethyltransferase GcvT [Lachnospiraceae bacterium]|nr:glycine cleavage system aminomethyltransferase GcvT [Lachnospiraceae bacterium]